MNDFAVFIMVHGRPDKNWTLPTLKRHGYTGKVYMIADDQDKTLPGYKKKYAENLIVFDKNLSFMNSDSGDNTGDLRSTLYAANESFNIAKRLGLKNYCLMCDDYTNFEFRYPINGKLTTQKVNNLDDIFAAYVNFLNKTSFTSIAFAQNGDFIGGIGSQMVSGYSMKRKVMNSFIISTEKPFKFMGRLNEDATTYVNLGSKGYLFGTIPYISLKQKPHQQEKKGLTDVYNDNGTYTKSFFSVMYNPSSVKVSMMGDKHYRIHHMINWKKAVPKILRESYKK